MMLDDHGRLDGQRGRFVGPAALVAERIALSRSLTTPEKREILDILGIDREVYEDGKKSPYYTNIKEWPCISQSTQEESAQDGPISTREDDQYRTAS